MDNLTHARESRSLSDRYLMSVRGGVAFPASEPLASVFGTTASVPPERPVNDLENRYPANCRMRSVMRSAPAERTHDDFIEEVRPCSSSSSCAY
jgi:hypothetical protein